MECLTSISYSILINGSPQQFFKPSRGLRQGDPLSPYLFIICAETLSRLLLDAKARGCITSFPIDREHLTISHLFFMNDSLLFCKANPIEWCNMLHLLETYKRAFGHMLNKDKTLIFFQQKYSLCCETNDYSDFKGKSH